jgi:sigma-B regulation protein RsbU (phosphoserine phosphatase)
MSYRHLGKRYEEILRAFLQGKGEDQLYLAQQLSKWLLTQNVAPEDMIDIHLRSLERLIDVPEPIRESFQLLTEVMIEYGNAYREHRSLRSKQQQFESEIEIAVTMQQTLLPSQLPSYAGLEIGLVSVPAKRMSGDYYNFVQHDAGSFSVAIADIAGKGIPAALCMSMIKYAMDSVLGIHIAPSLILRHLNGVVERNIDSSMFITMLYGVYDTVRHRFRYAVAGHEPGFLYRAAERRLRELAGNGLVLGVSREADYMEYEIELEQGDYLIFMTDGVTDRKIGADYLQREDLIAYMQAEIGCPAQTMADNLYRKLLRLSNFELPDDHTMIVIHRT